MTARLLTWEGFLAALTLLLLAAALLLVPNFASAFNLSQAAAGVSEKALLALPLVLLIVAREIDLSIASVLALASVVLGILVQAGASLPLAALGALATGAAAGAFNGALVAGLGLPSLVVTLGTLALFRGLGYILLGTGSVNAFPDAFTDLGIGTVAGTVVPWTLVPFLLLAPLFAVLLQRTPTGRRIHALGGNPEAARYAGVDGRRLVFALFVTSGVVAALAGIVFTARLANARANNALGFELDVITVALLGGVSVLGGRGTLTGVFWALLLLATLRNVLGLLQVGGDAQGIFVGLLLIGVLLAGNAAQPLFDRVRRRVAVPAPRADAAPEPASNPGRIEG